MIHMKSQVYLSESDIKCPVLMFRFYILTLKVPFTTEANNILIFLLLLF